ncbi:chaperonin 10-like protein [Xylaria flabelliformis]|nr:chaperonin 10-like protein [Xylaria flabelliformis]
MSEGGEYRDVARTLRLLQIKMFDGWDNVTAFYPSDKAPALVVESTAYPTPSSNEVIVRVTATAINPIDHKVQDLGTSLLPILKFPLVGGLDVAGTIVEVGSDVTNKYHLREGDRVLGFASEFASRAGAFQHYVAISADLVSKIPDGTSFVDAAVLPCCLATAAIGLYHYLGLEHPSASGNPRAQGKTVLISAGASSVGSNAIQLAVASGYEVFTTSSPRNFKHCTSLGAAKVFDYHSPTLASDIISALQGKQLAGAISCQEGSNGVVFEVVSASEGSQKVACMVIFSQEGVPAGITTEMVHAHWIKGTPLAETIYGKFLPQALASGRYKCEPKPLVVGKGLESVQAAFDISKTGSVSCQKLVVTLEGEA